MNPGRIAARMLMVGFDGLQAPSYILNLLSDGLAGTILFRRNIEELEQLLIEFDITRTNKLFDIFKFYLIIRRIIKNNYVNIEIDRFPHLLFVRKEII